MSNEQSGNVVSCSIKPSDHLQAVRLKQRLIMEIKDFSPEEKAILRFVSIYPEFTLQEFCKQQKSYYPELAIVMLPEKTLNELVKKGMAKIITKDNDTTGAATYKFLYEITISFKDGKEKIYNVEEAETEAMRLRYEICP